MPIKREKRREYPGHHDYGEGRILCGGRGEDEEEDIPQKGRGKERFLNKSGETRVGRKSFCGKISPDLGGKFQREKAREV